MTSLRLAIGAALLFLAASLDVEAQPAGKIARLGVLLFSSPEGDPNLPTFRQGLSELGYVEGKNLATVYRYGLVLNFMRDHESMMREMARVTRPGGRVAAYVWDYAGGMEMMRHFWDAAIAVSPNDAKLDQAERFPICQPGPLRTLFERAD